MKKRIFYILLLSTLLSGCAGIPFPKISTPKKPETLYNWTETENKIPKLLVGKNGKTYVAEEINASFVMFVSV